MGKISIAIVSYSDTFFFWYQNNLERKFRCYYFFKNIFGAKRKILAFLFQRQKKFGNIWKKFYIVKKTFTKELKKNKNGKKERKRSKKL